MYRFLRRPRWVLLTLGTLVAMVVMVSLASWQLRRLGERRDANRAIAARSAVEPAPLEDVLPRATSSLDDIGDAEWRRVAVTGTYDGARTVVVNGRSLDGVAGVHLVTPFVLADGRALLVNRGWIPPLPAAGATPTPEPRAGEVSIVGRVRATQTRGRLGPKDPATGTLTNVARVDVARIARQVPYPLVPAYVELVRDDDGTLPRPLPLPERDDGPHLSYAGQWALFAALAGGGWYALVRRRVKLDRQSAARAAASAAPTGGLTAAALATTNGDQAQPGGAAATREPPRTPGP